jgi:NTE family protein
MLLRLMSGSQYLYTNNGVRELVRNHLAGTMFEDLAIPFVAIASRIEDGGMRAFNSGPLELALLASTAVPGLFPPVDIEGVRYVDGSLAGNCSLSPALHLGCRRFVVVECPHPPPVDGFGVLKPVARALWASLVRSCHLEVASFAREYPVVHIEPGIPVPNHRFDDFSDANILIDRARRWCDDFLSGETGAKARGFAREVRDTAHASAPS